MKGVGLSLLWIASSVVSAQDLQSPKSNDEKARWTVALSTGIWGSKWQENLSGSSRHVYERAHLPIATTQLLRETAQGLVSIQLMSSSGKRNYDGWTSTGQPITSTSDVDLLGVQAGYQWKLSPEFSLGFRAEHELFSRQLNGVANVQGYLEDYAGLSLLLGGTKTIRFSGGHMLNLDAWYGGGKKHKLKLTVDPFDPSTVALGGTKKMDVAATWKSPLDRHHPSKWSLVGQIGFSKSETGQSELGFLKSQGGAAGTFIQPMTESSGWRITLGLAHTW